MTTSLSGLEEAIVQQYGLPWPEVDENAYPAVVTALNAYAQFTLDDGWAANRHMQRLLSSGRGEALTALQEHWVRVMDQDMAPVAKSANTLAGTVSEIPQAIVTLKQTIAYEARALADRNGITLAAGVLTFGGDATAAAATAATRDADVTRQRVAERIRSTASAVRQVLKGLLADPNVIALESVPADLANGVGGSVTTGAGAGAGIAGAGTGAWGGVAGGVAGGGGAAGGVAGRTSGGGAGDSRHAGGDGGTGGDLSGSTGVRVDHDEHKIAASRIASVSDDVLGRTSAELADAVSQHAAARAGGSFAEALAPDVDLILDRLAAATAAVGEHLAGALPDAILLISGDQQSTDDRNRRNFGEL
ncbi:MULTISPECIES: hypothetical protein [unclassified Streptomyces]|uniref:hypothetical protein n=1 Tax=unclassified Streptomyces TaxID=2593676 RepID=UPI0006FA7499|nr:MULTISPECIES: hypothetical protein [unclassified Streptomyces]KQX59407.1 hypothetical protein ASD33_03775 [Streptomyces sp. Root1304]KRB00668.1 hypothetical protein ASE09_03775 [Streptomyces sp. Root66D1]